MVSAGLNHSVFLKNGGTVWSFGSNTFGQLGDNSVTTRSRAVQVRKSTTTADWLTGCVAVAAGDQFSTALDASGLVYAWGNKLSGRLGDGTSSGTRLFAGLVYGGTSGTTPLSGIGRISSAGGSTLALKPATGNVWAWGNNASGQLGQGNTTNLSRALRVRLNATTFLPDALDIASGPEHSAVVRWKTGDPALQGRVFCFGQQRYGRLGNNLSTVATVSYPVQVVKGDGSPLENIVSVAAAAAHTLALDTNGNVWAWGYNLYGALGNGSTSSQRVAIRVKSPTGSGALSNIVRIAAGGTGLLGHSLAVDSSGTVYAWGYNGNGQLGNSTTSTAASSLPVAVSNNLNLLPPPPDVSLTHNITQSFSPGAVTLTANPTDPDNNITKVEFFSQGLLVGQASSAPWQLSLNNLPVGENHIYAKVSDASGLTGYSLPQQFNIVQSSPPTVSLSTDVTAGVFPGAVTFTAIPADLDDNVTQVNFYNNGILVGQATSAPWQVSISRLDAANYQASATVIDSTGLQGTSVPVSYSIAHDPASPDFDNDGLPNDWEIANGLNPHDKTGIHGASGDFDGDGYSNVTEFHQISNPNSHADTPKGMLALGYQHSLALTAHGRVWAWGYNSSGELGDGTNANRLAPVPLLSAAGMSKIVAIASGYSFSMALDENGALWAWGSNSQRQISRDAMSFARTPIRINLPTPIVRFACGDYHSLAVDRNGKLWAWGGNSDGQLGAGHNSLVEGFIEVTKPQGMGNVSFLAACGNSSYAIDIAGKAWAWGANWNGQLGDSSNSSRYSPVAISTSTGLSSVKSIAPGESHALALAADGSIWAWGNNGDGRLGTGNSISSNKPVKLTGLLLANALAAGRLHSLAVSPAGQVLTWGRNFNGQLGINSTTASNAPVLTAAVTDWSSLIKVSGGGIHSAALKSDGTVWTWGNNAHGQLGHGNTLQRTVATRILNLKLTNDDSDLDGLPDSWERFYHGNLTQNGSGVGVANGITNTVAYSVGLNPLLLDNDNDGISDAVEISNGLDPLDWSDATGDLDGDRIPNLWEMAMGTSMTDSNSKPVATATVSPGQSIQAVINSIAGNSSNPPWVIIQVQPGLYPGNLTLNSDKRILLISASPGGIPEIQGTTTAATITVYGDSVVDGFRISHAKGVTGRGVESFVSGGRALWRIVNCLIHNNSGAGIFTQFGRTVVAHCSIFQNSAITNSNGICIQGNIPLILINSICWNASGSALPEIVSNGTLISTQSIVRDGTASGAILSDPLMNPLGLLKSASPARNIGSSKALAPKDIHGELRGLLSDIGADHFVDTDGDGLPDWLELLGVTSPHADNDSDGLTNLFEYILGYDPLNPDTLGDQQGDLFHAVFSTDDAYYPSEWRLDSDNDGLTNGEELYYQTSPSNPDTNGDGISDFFAIMIGISPTSNDTDGDGTSNAVEIANGTSPLLADTDGDGVNDNLDPFPHDPTVWSLLPSSPTDSTAPVITLLEPVGAVPVP
jgi:alpha-tubulin suppressor-like RCC1 family protein